MTTPKLLNIITEPDARLHMVSQDVGEVNDEVRQLMDDMLHTMYNARGIGLAAVQVAVLKRVLVVDVDYLSGSGGGGEELHNGKALYMVNPVIIDKSAELYAYDEGCLSVPSVYQSVKRSKFITVRYINYDGEVVEYAPPPGILTVCIQHEIDHLNGVLFIDYLSRLKKSMALKKLRKYSKMRETNDV